MKRVYLDHAATTPVEPAVAELVLDYMVNNFGNVSSVHSFGRRAKKGLEAAREHVAALVGALPSEIVFTSGGTESDNLAIKGALEAYKRKGNHVVTSSIEHHALLHTCEHLGKNGYEVTYIPVDSDGFVRPEDVAAAIRPDTVVVSVMMANNEVGTLQPIKEIGAICREKRVLLHTDAVQALGQIPIDVNEMNIDLMSISSHKIYGPKGIGALYIRKGVRVAPQALGGAHERGRRAGTENVSGAVGFGKAAQLALENLHTRAAHYSGLRDRLIDGILKTIPDVRLNGHRTKRLPNNVNVSVRYIEGESLLLNLDLVGIAASSGSACTSGSLDPSHVLLAMGLSHEEAHGSLRFTVGTGTSADDIDYVIDKLSEITVRLRAMSPLGPGIDFEDGN